MSCKSRITGTTYAHRSRARSRARVYTRARVRARLYVGLVPCLNYQTTGHNSARELNAAGDEPDVQFCAAFTCRCDFTTLHAALLIRFLRDLSGSCDDYTAVFPMNLTRMAHERWYTRADVFAKFTTHKYQTD